MPKASSDVANPYWDAVRELPADRFLRGTTWAPAWLPWDAMLAGEPVDPMRTRDHLVHVYAWAICSPDTLTWLTGELAGRPVVEIGAGTGYWAWLLTQGGVDVVAYDQQPREGPHRIDLDGPAANERGYHRVLAGGPADAASHADRVLMLVWPPRADPMAADALDAYAGDTVVYVGECGGATADERFVGALASRFELVAHCPHYVSWAMLKDHLTIWRRRT